MTTRGAESSPPSPFSLACPSPPATGRKAGLFATRSVVHARRGMVAAAHPLAAWIGLDVLKRGGTAVDAAIATNAALGSSSRSPAGSAATSLRSSGTQSRAAFTA